MEIFVLVYRVVALLIILTWSRQLLEALRKPPDWTPAWVKSSPISLTRDRTIVVSIAGIVAGFGVLLFSFFYFG